MSPFDSRAALGLYPTDDLLLAMHMYSIIGGVAAYARAMVDNDLPADRKDLGRWVAQRILAPSAPLSREAEVLLSARFARNLVIKSTDRSDVELVDLERLYTGT